MSETETAQQESVYALIWKANVSDDEFDQEEFTARIPRLMVWLKGLYEQGKLAGCGGGGFENHAGGLTLIRANSPEEALELGAGTPMNEIGTTELFEWDTFYADLVVKEREEKLRS